MTPKEIKEIQQKLLEGGFYTGKVDGDWGPASAAAMQAAMAALALRTSTEVPVVSTASGAAVPLAWGARVSPAFRTRVRTICTDLGFDPSWLMACMAFESGETFRANIKNAAGSGAVGLIQFMPRTAEELGTSVDLLGMLSPEEQLDFVYRYFLPYKGKLKALSDVYMAILWPAAIGRPEDSILWSKEQRPTTYRQNSGLDSNKDAIITKAEAASKVAAKLKAGLTLGVAAI